MSFSLDSITTGVTDFVKGSASKVSSILDPSGSRLSIAGLVQGGLKKKETVPETRVGFSVANPKGNPVPIDKDWKVKIYIKSSSKILYWQDKPGILWPLTKTDGVVFPYTPSITITQTAGYGSVKPTHSNYPAYYYESSEVQAINVSGDFTIKNTEEGQYLLACIYFLRACTKMFYGQSRYAGNPPPIVFLSGYGAELLPNVPCVVTSFQQVMTPEVDYIEVPSLLQDPRYFDNSGAPPADESVSAGKGRSTRLPTTCQLQVTLQPVYSRLRQRTFSLDKFAAGEQLDQGFL